MEPAAIATACWLVVAPVRAAPGVGTLDDPVLVDAFPYVIAGSTQGAPSSAIDSYDCSPGTDESGAEAVYRFSLPDAARVTAWVEGDDGAVDIDVHLLDVLDVVGGVANGCAGRGNVIAEAEMAAGEHWVVVDSYDGDAQAGDYVLHLEAIGDAWIERPVAVGVSWRARRYQDLNGPQVVHELIVDTSSADVSIRAVASTGCQTVAALGEAAGAVAGINGGYFGGGCAPVSLLIASGAFVGTNAVTRGAFGMTTDRVPMVDVVSAGQDWPEAHEAHGGGPILVLDGVAQQGTDTWATEGFTTGSFLGDNPRTFAGVDASGRSHLLTVDGRRGNAAGMSLDELAAFAQSSEVGLSDAVNLDGGGSTTLWVDGLTPNGVLNYPSDGTQEDPTHPGSRANSGGLFVFAPAYNHPPRFQTSPMTEAVAGTSYSYDADVIDLDVDDVVTFALPAGPEGMSIDAVSGELSYEPTPSSPPSVEIVISASDDRGAATEQSYTLTIEGGAGAAGAGGGGGSGGAGGGGLGAGGELADDAPIEEGCSCRAAPATGASWPWWTLGLVAWLWRRERSRSRTRG